MLDLLATGGVNWIKAPDGITTDSLFTGKGAGVGAGVKAIEGGLDGGAEAVGTTCWDAIASCKRHLTSSADAKSTGAWPSWFFRNGSAPWASWNSNLN